MAKGKNKEVLGAETKGTFISLEARLNQQLQRGAQQPVCVQCCRKELN